MLSIVMLSFVMLSLAASLTIIVRTGLAYGESDCPVYFHVYGL
jgi:hypothetical protein